MQLLDENLTGVELYGEKKQTIVDDTNLVVTFHSALSDILKSIMSVISVFTHLPFDWKAFILLVDCTKLHFH